MLNRLGVKLAIFLLNRGNLSLDDSTILTTSVLDKLGALPYRDMIGIDSDHNLVIGGQTLNMDDARNLRESAIAAVENQALNLVCEQILFLSVTHGVHKAETQYQILWGRVGIWWAQNVRTVLLSLAQRDSVV